MNCPRCGSESVRLSQSQDSVWFRFVLHKMMRCHRCCYAFAAPLWEQPLQKPVAQHPVETTPAWNWKLWRSNQVAKQPCVTTQAAACPTGSGLTSSEMTTTR